MVEETPIRVTLTARGTVIAIERSATVDRRSAGHSYFQSIITVLLAVALLFQVRFFDLTHSERTKEVDPLLRLVMMAVITATLFASLEAMREGWGPLAAALVTIG